MSLRRAAIDWSADSKLMGIMPAFEWHAGTQPSMSLVESVMTKRRTNGLVERGLGNLQFTVASDNLQVNLAMQKILTDRTVGRASIEPKDESILCTEKSDFEVYLPRA